ncbi:hypothetical protein X798_01820 [Onchocerca flexuosa]|uniref:Uncharacterized protein n=1 Tax=Onchocerca flexuosa TaxID=387005 RepID=A0A238C0U8_9BILA|nr:hypothetical protein X798_01820 [Onchocerca flexuosa]
MEQQVIQILPVIFVSSLTCYDGLPGMQAIFGKSDEPTDIPRPVVLPGEPNIVVNDKLEPNWHARSCKIIGNPQIPGFKVLPVHFLLKIGLA